MDGKRLEKGIIVNEDRISELPDALLEQILCLLPTKDVTATSVLSKRYRYLWKMVPKLSFELLDKNVKGFFENIGKSLLSHKAPILESLNIHVNHKYCDAVDIGICIGIAFTRHLRELDLTVRFKEPVRFPTSLLVSNTLETLKLNCSFVVDSSITVSMKSLRTLHLVVYKDDESVCKLLSGCPNLENLLVHRPFKSSFIGNFSIIVPSLKTLSIEDFIGQKKNVGSYVINTPLLKFLSITKLNDSKFCFTENLSELVEASISLLSYVSSENILGSVKSVKRLSLGLTTTEIAYPSGVIFSQLEYLEIDTKNVVCWKPWNLLMLILDHSPKLQLLKLVDENMWFSRDYRIRGEWNQPKYVPDCLLFHLKTFVWKRYDSERYEEKEVITYILRNAKQLKKAIFSVRSNQSNRLEKRSKLLKDLDGVVMGSDSCQIIVSQ